MDKLKYLYHYTSLGVLCELFNKIHDNHFLFHASSVDFMNDSAEYVAAKNHCCDCVDEIIMQTVLGLPFAICFSEVEDNMPMWNMYANCGKGVCMKFNFQKLYNYFENFKNKDEREIRFDKCSYQNKYPVEKQKSLISNKEYPDIENLRKKMTKAAFKKTDCFKYEKEWRVMIWQKWIANGKYQILFKETKDSFRPYIKISIPVDCLETIILGSNANEQIIEATRLLKLKCGKDISVEKTNLTLKE